MMMIIIMMTGASLLSWFKYLRQLKQPWPQQQHDHQCFVRFNHVTIFFNRLSQSHVGARAAAAAAAAMVAAADNRDVHCNICRTTGFYKHLPFHYQRCVRSQSSVRRSREHCLR